MSGLHSDFYTQYITSDEWAKRRSEYYRSHPKRCRGCYSNKFIHLHHHTYERLGQELDGDLVPLCRECHEKVHLYHNLHKAEQDLTTSTLKWLVRRNPRLKYTKTPSPTRATRPPLSRPAKKRRRKKKRVRIIYTGMTQ